MRPLFILLIFFTLVTNNISAQSDTSYYRGSGTIDSLTLDSLTNTNKVHRRLENQIDSLNKKFDSLNKAILPFTKPPTKTIDIYNSVVVPLLIVIIALVTVSTVIFFVLSRFGRKSSFFFQKLFSNFEIIPKRNFYMAEFYDEVYSFLSELEFRYQIRLSDEAKQLLTLPLLEFRRISRRDTDRYLYDRPEFGNDINYWRESLTKLVESMKSDPAQIDRYETGIRRDERTSLSVIKAFSSRFCNIPPFCGER